MKKTTALLLAALLLLTACGRTEPQADPNPSAAETADPLVPPLTDGTETPPETEETENTGTPSPDVPAEPLVPDTPTVPAEPAADPPAPEAPSAGDTGTGSTKPVTGSTPGVIVMTVPTAYTQVYDRLEEFRSTDNWYYDYDIVAEEEVMEEAVMEAPATGTAASDMIVMEPAVEKSPANDSTIYKNDEYSRTNTQVADIDEGDIVKTDGEYIYILRNGSELIILSAAGEDTEVLSRTTVSASEKDEDDSTYYGFHQYGTELYVYEDCLAVTLSCDEWHEVLYKGMWESSYNNYTAIDFYDISDPSAPEKTGSLGQDGYCSASRMMDGVVYLVTNYSIPYGYEREDYDSYIPALYTLYNLGKREFVPVDSIVCPGELRTRAYTIVSAYSITNASLLRTKSVLGRNGTVYMSGDHLYLADSYYYDDVLEEYTERVYTVQEVVSGYRTEILKLDLTDPDSIVTEAAGTVDGELLNQFSMDEYDGHLRVVTTYWQNSRKVYTDEELGFTNVKYEDSGQTNGLYILDEDMNIVGAVTGLAEDERVYSVRFTGDVGYFVTFRQVDPLFSVDLSDPTDPKIMGKLKIPGFSNYLHPYSDTLLFGLGQDADENTGWTTGMKLSMFDISDPYDVTERDKLLLDMGYSTALYNHKAILISPARGIIGFPYDGGYVVYGYDADSGFYEITRTELDDVYWNGNSRGLYVGDMMYIVLQDMTVVLDMEDFEPLATVAYGD